MHAVHVAVLAAAVGLASASIRAQGAGWTIPSGASRLTSPIASTPASRRKGRDLFASNCAKCHGPEGKGDGRYADPAHPPADLTRSTPSGDPDGVLFYKIWNGRKPMPAFKSLLTENDIWTVVDYVGTLRQP